MNDKVTGNTFEDARTLLLAAADHAASGDPDFPTHKFLRALINASAKPGGIENSNLTGFNTPVAIEMFYVKEGALINHFAESPPSEAETAHPGSDICREAVFSALERAASWHPST